MTEHIEDLPYYESTLLECFEANIRVEFHGRLGEADRKVNGTFDAKDDGSDMVIRIYRDHGMKIPDLRHDLFTLAHELGHAISLLAGNKTARVVETVLNTPEAMPIAERIAYAEEEQRAWDNARQVLAQRSYPHMDALAEHEREAMAAMREVLRLPAVDD